MNPSSKNGKKDYSAQSSKIKDILVELHNYTFFHSPTSTYKVYNRYIGREKILRKLKAILDNSETKSGAYLVTGFRGMGKTSLVRKVLNDLRGNKFYATYRHIRILIILLLLAVFDRSVYGAPAFCVTIGVLFLASVVYLVHYDSSRANRQAYLNRRYRRPLVGYLIHCAKSFFRLFDTEADFYSKRNFLKLLQDFILVCVLFIIGMNWAQKSWSFWSSENPLSFFTKASHFLYVSIIYYLLILIINSYQLQIRKEQHPHGIMTFIWGLRELVTTLIRRFNHGQRIDIEISLSQERLEEKDILKLLAQNMLDRYQSARRKIFTLHRFFVPITLLFLVFSLAGIAYYHQNSYRTILYQRAASNYYQFFPSQALFPIVAKKERWNEINKLIELVRDSALNNEEYIAKINEVNGYTANPFDTTKFSDYPTVIIKDSLQRFNNLRKFTISLDNYLFSKYQNLVSHHRVDLANHVKPDSINPTYQNRFNQPDTWLSRNFRVSADFHFIPLVLNYDFFLLLFLVVAVFRAIARRSYLFGIINHRYVLRKLKDLNENLSASITLTSQNGATGSIPYIRQSFNFFRGRQRVKPIAGIREIESELISILRDMDRIPQISARPEFIFIFDELDKIDPRVNPILSEKEADAADEKPDFTSTETTRQRQDRIFNILGNLKLFFNTASAKFIFIAGREMYDSALADISDRDAFISSIFHEVIYVNSFFKDPASKQTHGITGLTEQYVCQFLIPPGSNYSHTLKGYHDYLIEHHLLKPDNKYRTKQIFDKIERFTAQKIHIFGKETTTATFSVILSSLLFSTIGLVILLLNPGLIIVPIILLVISAIGILSAWDREIPTPILEFSKLLFTHKSATEEEIKNQYSLNRREIRKVLYCLQHFVVYLTWRSNGAPKKISKLFEEFVEKPEHDYLRGENPEKVIIGRSTESLYLNFNYIAQYRFSISNQLFRPFLIAHSRYIRDFSDKLLIATTFLMDHIFKYHKAGFSLRNLELTPELIGINKTPELRKFIVSMVDFLSSHHLHTILGGLHEYKFHHKISNEVAYISKISDIESAAFNFTLDESRLLKKHYHRKLNQLISLYKQRKGDADPAMHIHSIGYIQMLLGDLHFYDEEYEDAALQYQDTLQYVRNQDVTKLTLSQLLVVVRYMLRLGHAFERMKAADTAFSLYGYLGEMISNFIKNSQKQYQEKYHQNGHKKVITLTDGSRKKIDITPFPITLMGSSRLLYQPLIAELLLTEKAGHNGISYENVTRVRNHFLNITEHINLEEKFLIRTEFYSKLGDLLYYKNSFLGRPLEKALGINKKQAIYHRKNDEVIHHLATYLKLYDKRPQTGGESRLHTLQQDSDFTPTVPLFALREYTVGTHKLLVRLLGIKESMDTSPIPIDKKVLNAQPKLNVDRYANEQGSALHKLLVHTLKFVYPSDAKKREVETVYGETSLVSLGMLLSNIGDCLICFLSKDDKMNISIVFDLLMSKRDELNADCFKYYTGKENHYQLIELIVSFHMLSGICFRIANRYQRFAVQWRKILYFFKIYFDHHETDRCKIAVRARKHKDIFKAYQKQFYKKASDYNNFVNRILTKIYQDFVEGGIYWGFDAGSRFTRIQEGSKYQQNVESSFASVGLNYDWQKDSPLFQNESRWLHNANLNSSPEIKETRVLFEGLRLTLSPSADHLGPRIWRLVSPYTNITNKFTRLQELNLKVNYHLRVLLESDFGRIVMAKMLKEGPKDGLKESVEEKLPENWRAAIGKPFDNWEKEFKKDPEKYEFIISDAIFCLNEISRIYRIFGVSYMVNHSFLALSYDEMGDFLVLYHLILDHQRKEKGLNYLEDKVSIEQKVTNLLRKQEVHFLNPNYYYQLALENFEKAYQMHREGNTYKAVIKEMYYLDDDFSDEQYHSCAALERYRINIGVHHRATRLIAEVKRPFVGKAFPHLAGQLESSLDDGDDFLSEVD